MKVTFIFMDWCTFKDDSFINENTLHNFYGLNVAEFTGRVPEKNLLATVI